MAPERQHTVIGDETAPPETAGRLMRAIVQDGYGCAERPAPRADHPRPSPGDGEVLLHVHAAGLDRGQWHLMTGRPYLLRPIAGVRGPRNPVMGLDVAGTVVAARPGGDPVRRR